MPSSYGRHPERQAGNDHLRSLPPLFQPGGRCFDPVVCGKADGLFHAIDTIHVDQVTVGQLASALRRALDAGAQVRIGAVLTDAALAPDAPVSLGVRHFCSICRKCAEACPSRALETGGPREVAGVVKWPTDAERCYGYWRVAGTDCGICMAVCPFSHRDSWLHRGVRCLARALPASHRAAKWCDDLLYPPTRFARGRQGVSGKRGAFGRGGAIGVASQHAV